MSQPDPSLRQSTLLLWESDITTATDGRATVTPRRLVSECSVARARAILGLPKESTALIYRLYRAGILKGMKPGAIHQRKDGKNSNAKLILDMESVLEYREKCRRQRA